MGPGEEIGLRLDQSRSPLGVRAWDAESLDQWVVRQERSRSLQVALCWFGRVTGGKAHRLQTEDCKPFTAVPETSSGPFVAFKKLYFTRRLSKFLLMMHLQSHHQANEFGKHWVNKATGISRLQDFTEPFIG